VKTTLSINGQAVSLDRLWQPAMSLSSSKSAGRLMSYRLAIDQASVLPKLAAAYDECVQELKRDDAVTGNTDFFGKAGYPPLDVLLAQPELLSEVVSTYFQDEIFSALSLSKPEKTSGPSYAVDGVNSVYLLDNELVLEGECYEF
jgi:hypothetical protein